MLEFKNVVAAYQRTAVIHGVTLAARPGQVVAVLGANGAGKSTLVRVAAGILPAREGSVELDGRPLDRVRPHRRVRLGLAVVTEQKDLFSGLSVADHLELGGRNLDARTREHALSRVHRLFPVLAERSSATAGNLSGGQQQMLAIGRALAGGPKCLILDEPSLGVAPQLVADILRTVRSLADEGLTVVLVEQNARQALRIADRAVVLQRGRVAFAGAADELAEPSVLSSFYLGGV